jgi:hypothetical protein
VVPTCTDLILIAPIPSVGVPLADCSVVRRGSWTGAIVQVLHITTAHIYIYR